MLPSVFSGAAGQHSSGGIAEDDSPTCCGYADERRPLGRDTATKRKQGAVVPEKPTSIVRSFDDRHSTTALWRSNFWIERHQRDPLTIGLYQADVVLCLHRAKAAAAKPTLWVLDPPANRSGPAQHARAQIPIDRAEHRVGAHQQIAGIDGTATVGGALRHGRGDSLRYNRKDEGENHSVNKSANAIANATLSIVQIATSNTERV